MTADRLLARLRDRGITVAVDAGGKLRVRPPSRVSDGERQLLARLRAEVVALLVAEIARPEPQATPPGDARPPVPVPEPAPPVAVPAAQERPAAAEGPALLPRDKWAAVRLREIRGPSGEAVVTHPAGDSYALDVLSGVIPYEVALRRERRVDREVYARSTERARHEHYLASLLGLGDLRRAR